MRIGKLIKILGKLVLLFAIFSFIYIGFLYIKYDEDLPGGAQGTEADALANKMLDALNHQTFENTNYIEWTFRNKNHYKWSKNKGVCDVIWKDFKVRLNLKEMDKSKAFVHNFEVHDKQAQELIRKATNYFNNDSFWLVAPYKVFDEGAERRLVKLDNGKDGLLITYTSGGSTPGDSYLWYLEDSGKPIMFKMWTSKIPFDGIEASWNEWTTTQSGALLPLEHKVLFMKLKMGEVKGMN